MSEKIDMKTLLESGAHFGHKTSRWHPKMAPYIHSRKNGAHIINLEKTVEALETARVILETIFRIRPGELDSLNRYFST